MEFEFATAGRIIFGNGSITKLGGLIGELGGRVLLVWNTSRDRFQYVNNLLAKSGMPVFSLQVTGEPSLELVRSGVEHARQNECDVVTGIGGGSAIDAGKAIAALVKNPGDILDYVEVIGRGKALAQDGLPFIAVPTTAGTGSEVTRNAVIVSPDHGVKVSLRNVWMLPEVALVDPELSHTLPAMQTATCGMDALTQLIEPYTCNRTNPVVDPLCLEGIRLAAHYLRIVYKDGQNTEAREAMSLAALYGGIALANARLGAVHGFAAPIGGARSAPHGAVCARLLPVVVECNLKALRGRDPENAALERYRKVARICTGDEQATPDELVRWLYTLREDLEIPALSDFGFGRDDITSLVANASQASSMKGNPILLNPDELEWILTKAL
jgi:alcohol dehydrogenase class IV